MSLASGRITAAREVIYGRYDPAAFVGRGWLLAEIERFRKDLGRRHLVIVGKPGSGKSAFIAYLAEHWNCPRHFIRVDSVGGVTLVRCYFAAREAGGDLRLACPSPHVQRLFKSIQVERVIPLYSTVAAACEDFTAG